MGDSVTSMQGGTLSGMKTALFAAFLALPLAAAAQYRCAGADGRTTFQQAACPAAMNGERIALRDRAPADPGRAQSGPSFEQRELAAIERRMEIQRGINGGIPVVGMTADQLNRALGGPSAINVTQGEGATRPQFVYYRGSATWYVYLRDGVVSTVQASIR